MPSNLDIEFSELSHKLEAVAVVLVAASVDQASEAAKLDGRALGALSRAREAADFKAGAKSCLEVLGADGGGPRRILQVGMGKPADLKEADRIALGGYIHGQISLRKGKRASLICELPGGGPDEGLDGAMLAAELAMGAVLASYRFDQYRTKPQNEDESADKAEGEAKPDAKSDGKLKRLTIHVADPGRARGHFQRLQAVAKGVCLARDLVNEPANVLGPVEFAERIQALEEAGLSVEIFDETKLAELKMRALLAVAQGSVKPARVAVITWRGDKSSKAKPSKPLLFIGKGVTFDTGGISIKPAAGMEDMKGDMGGAAAVCGLMLALAGRKAKVHAVGIVGLVENMPSGTAQRPGDVVTSLSGQTIEVINTDAEGRLVLADLISYGEERFKPKLIVDLATLTGAIMVALGKEHAGLFSNDDALSVDLTSAGEATGERLWRMPMGKAYDKMIDSRIADMKNIGGRFGGSITAAQFLKRFVKGTPWAHLDIAGTAMDSAKSDINSSWGSGYGVRLLDRFVADHHEPDARSAPEARQA